MSTQRDRQQGPPDLPVAEDALRQAVSDSFIKGVGRAAGGDSPHGRPHQIDAVTALVTAVRHDCRQPTATNYLLQHSAGSGKSLTIAALVAALLRIVDEAGRSFHSVLVVNDRLQLDQQLGDTVSSFIAGNGFPSSTVARANSSNQLRSLLLAAASDPKRPAVILTTIQKLGSLWRNTDSKAWKRASKQSETSKPWTSEQGPADPDQAATDPDPDQAATTDRKTLEPGSRDLIKGDNAGSNSRTLADVQSDARSLLIRVLAQGRVAIIADEAHRHHGNSTAEQISAILAAAFGSGAGTAAAAAAAAGSKKRKLGRAAADQGDATMHHQQQQQQQPRFVTYFGFTATPGPRALQLFGVAQQVQVDILGTVLPAAAAASKTAEAIVQPAVSSVQQQQQHMQKQVQQANGRLNSHTPSEEGQPEDTLQQQQHYVAPATLYTPFHSYTLQQATSDGFVLDVLQRFVSVTPRIQIAGLQLTEQQQQQLLKLDQANRIGIGSRSSTSGGQSLRSDLFGPTAAAAAAAAARSAAGISNPGAGLHNSSGPSLAEELLVQAASNSRQLVAVKAEAVVGRFMSAWGEAAACGFVSFRAMLVVRSRQHVMWYVQELRSLLQQHSQRAAELLRQAGEPADLRSASSVATGDTAPLCYGAYSGSVAMSAAETHKLWDSSSSSTRESQQAGMTATAAAVDVAGSGNLAAKSAAAAAGKRKPPNAAAAAVAAGKLRKSSSGSGRDGASAGVDMQHQQAQKQQQRINGLSPDGAAAAAAAAASDADMKQEDSSWFLRSSRPSSAAQQQTGDSSSSSDDVREAEVKEEVNGSTAMDTGSDGGSECLAGSTSSSSESESDSNEDEHDRDRVAAAAAAVGSRSRKKVRRDSSTLSCSTANTAAAAENAEDLGRDLESPDLRSSDPEDNLPLSTRLQQQQQQQQLPVRPAAAALDLGDQGCDLAFVSERDLNPSGFGPADARLLVVCSKFETGYDDPRLGAMFVDRSLSGARAVQVLGRINRPAPGKGLPLMHRPVTDTGICTDSSHQHSQQHTAAAAAAAGSTGLLRSSIDCGIKQDLGDPSIVGDPAAAAAGGGGGGGAAAAGAGSEGRSGNSTTVDRSVAAAKLPSPPPAAEDPTAAAANAEGGYGPGFRVVVVDFVNSVGAIKEAFSEFCGTTTYCTGSQAKRRRQHQALDDSLTRVLELLQPAAARQATRNKLLLKQQQQGKDNAASRGSSSSSRLADLNVDQMVGLVGGLAPETQRRVEEDLSQYCTCCTRLRVEKLEFPYIFAQALLAQLTARRQRREKAASSGRFAWMEQLHIAAAAAAAAAAKGDQDGDQAVGDDGGLDQQQRLETEAAAAAAAGEGDDQDDDSSGKQPFAASKLRQKLNVSVRVCELETTFAGAVKLSASDQPLRSVKLSSHLSAAAAAARSGSNVAAAANPGKQVGSGRPLHEVIAAANAQLAGRFRKQVVEGLRELCERLKGAEGRLAAVERWRQGHRAAAAAPAAAVRVEVLRDPQQQQQQGLAAAAATGAAGDQSQQQQEPAPAPAAAADGEVGEDVYKILSLLRRLQLWPVTAELLKTTAAGKQVSALRNHQHPQVSQLATEVVQQWKAQLAVQAAAAAAKKAQQQQSAAAAGSSAAGKSGGQPSPTAAAAAIDQDLRRKVGNMMRDALVDHRQKVLAQQQQQQHNGDRSTAPGSSNDTCRISLPAGELSRLQHLADVLELELYQYVTNQTSNNGKTTQTLAAAAAAAGSGSSGRGGNAVQVYKSRARMLCTGIRYADGVALDLISGAKIASEVVGLDALSLAPAPVQEAIRKRHEEQCRAEEHWESLVQGTVGGGGTFVTTEVSCPQCGKKRAQVHDILSGGTYAQERVPIQKYVCQECSHTWRNE